MRHSRLQSSADQNRTQAINQNSCVVYTSSYHKVETRRCQLLLLSDIAVIRILLSRRIPAYRPYKTSFREENVTSRSKFHVYPLSCLCLIVCIGLYGNLVRAGSSAHPPSIHYTKHQSMVSNHNEYRSRVYVHSSLNEDVDFSCELTIPRGRNCRRPNHHLFKFVPLRATRALFRVPTITLTMIMWFDSTCALLRLKTASLADLCLAEPVY